MAARDFRQTEIFLLLWFKICNKPCLKNSPSAVRLLLKWDRVCVYFRHDTTIHPLDFFPLCLLVGVTEVFDLAPVDWRAVSSQGPSGCGQWYSLATLHFTCYSFVLFALSVILHYQKPGI